jgi:hypothetical protein
VSARAIPDGRGPRRDDDLRNSKSLHREVEQMGHKKLWEIGGFVAGGLLIVFGVVAIILGVNGYNTTRDSIKSEGITFGPSSDPAVAKYADQWAGQQVETGDQARAFAKIMRMHVLEATGGLTYAQMGRYQSAKDPSSQAGTNDEAQAAKDQSGQPVSNGARNIWVTETALTTALNVSYLAERLSIFGIVVGVALLLTGFGLVILAFAVFGRVVEEKEPAAVRPTPTSRSAKGRRKPPLRHLSSFPRATRGRHTTRRALARRTMRRCPRSLARFSSASTERRGVAARLPLRSTSSATDPRSRS